jgi:hypothetical protein
MAKEWYTDTVEGAKHRDQTQAELDAQAERHGAPARPGRFPWKGRPLSERGDIELPAKPMKRSTDKVGPSKHKPMRKATRKLSGGKR